MAPLWAVEVSGLGIGGRVSAPKLCGVVFGVATLGGSEIVPSLGLVFGGSGQTGGCIESVFSFCESFWWLTL